MKNTRQQKIRRAHRTRASVGHSAPDCPRLSVFRSNLHVHAQIINDIDGRTIVSASSVGRKTKKGETKIDVARDVGVKIAKEAREQGIERVVFDRGPYKYHGRVKALAEGARESGLIF